jgi:hypothetical protein
MNIDLNILWGLVIVVIILNLIIYLVEPLKYTETKECLKLPCRQFVLFNQILGFLFDICIVVVIFKMLGTGKTALVFIVFFFLAIILYTSWFVAKPVVKNNKINPPPEMFIKKDARIGLQVCILLLDLIIFFLLFMIRAGIDNKNTLNNNRIISNSFIYKGIITSWGKRYGITNLLNTRFGGNVDGNRFVFACGWVAFLGIFQNIYNLYKTVTFQPAFYNLPLSWRK